MRHEKKSRAHPTSQEKWYIAVLLTRCEYYDEEGLQSGEHEADEDFVLIRARNPDHAFDKAMEYGMAGKDMEFVDVETERKGRWVFEGLVDLGPIGETPDDEVEVYCVMHKALPTAELKAMLKTKEQLLATIRSEA